MERMARAEWFLDIAWLVVCALLSSIWCVTAAHALSATFDEPIYLERGLEGWRSGSHSGLLRLGTMPLPIDVQTLPLYLWERWNGETFDPQQDLNRLLPWARAGTLVFWWLLLTYGMLIARALAGPWAGRLAVALLASEPCLLANASLATTDLALTACLLALVYHYRQGRESGWPRRVALPAFWFGAAVLAKASGVVYGPICMFVVEMERLWRAPHDDMQSPWVWSFSTIWRWPWSPALRPMWRDGFWIGGLGMALVFVYCGSDWRPEPSFVAWARGLPEGTGRTVTLWLAENLCIFSNAGEGIVRQIKHNLHGHSAYLLGESDRRALWYYFPVLLSIKLSMPVLLIPLVVAIARPRALANWACLCALVLLVCSLNFRVQIGVRLVLPLIALGIAGLAAALVEIGQTWRMSAKRNVVVAGAALAVLWTAYTSASVWPQALCYTNELWGGTANGYRIVSDANYDWGQGLAELEQWQKLRIADWGLQIEKKSAIRNQQSAVPRTLAVWYFGCEPAMRGRPLRNMPLHMLSLQSREDVEKQVRGHYVAASTTLLYGSMMHNKDHCHASAFLREQRPVHRTMTFFIYDFTDTGYRSVPGSAWDRTALEALPR